MRNRWQHICGAIVRTLLGLTFVFSGFVKAVDPLGTTYKIEDYLKAFGGVFNTFLPMAEVGAWCLIIFEFALGLCLLLNIRTNITSWLALAMMLVMTPITLYLAITNPIHDCGCFGDAIVLTNWATFWKNIVLLVLVIALLLLKKYIPQTFNTIAELVIFCISLCAVVGFMLYVRLHLPPIDFRPYKIGNNLPELMEYPEGAKTDVYEVSLIYEKDGVQQTFSLKDYPRGDTTWVFVDQKSVLIEKGYEPPIHDFEIINHDFEDITDDVLQAEKAVLVIMYDLQKADKKQLAKVAQLAAQHEFDDTQFYILTGSGSQDVEQLCAESELREELFCTTDPVTLKTIVRANPGVIELNYGTVVDKYNLRNR